MNVSLSFNVIISKCLFDIKQEISNCGKQLEITHEQIVEIEKIQKSQVINATELGLSVQKLNLLFVDNYFLIDKQLKLIEYYRDLMRLMNKQSMSDFFVNNKISLHQDPVNQLIDYYESHNCFEIVKILKKYSNNLKVEN